MIGCGLYSYVDPFDDAACLQPDEYVIDRSPLGQRVDLIGDAAHKGGEKLLAGLDAGAIQHPIVARHDPTNPVRVHTVLHEPDASIHPRFSGPDHDILAVSMRHTRQIVRWHAGDAGRHPVLRGALPGQAPFAGHKGTYR